MIFQQIAVFVQKAEVHTPGVNADAVKAAVQHCLVDALLNLIKESEGIPVESSVHLDRVVGETVNLPNIDLAAVVAADHSSSAGSAKIKSQNLFLQAVHLTLSVIFV